MAGIKSYITPGMLGDAKSMKKEANGTRKLLGFIYGRATGLKGETNKKTGDAQNALIGMFEAVNADGEVIANSGKCYLSRAAHQLVEGAVMASDEGAKGVDFSFQVDVVADDDAVTGYVYELIPQRRPEEADPLAEMRKNIADKKVAALPAPKAAKPASKEKAD